MLWIRHSNNHIRPDYKKLLVSVWMKPNLIKALPHTNVLAAALFCSATLYCKQWNDARKSSHRATQVWKLRQITAYHALVVDVQNTSRAQPGRLSIHKGNNEWADCVFVWARPDFRDWIPNQPWSSHVFPNFMCDKHKAKPSCSYWYYYF